MNWTREKSSWEGKAANGEMLYCMLGFGGGSLNNDLESRPLGNGRL